MKAKKRAGITIFVSDEALEASPVLLRLIVKVIAMLPVRPKARVRR